MAIIARGQITIHIAEVGEGGTNIVEFTTHTRQFNMSLFNKYATIGHNENWVSVSNTSAIKVGDIGIINCMISDRDNIVGQLYVKIKSKTSNSIYGTTISSILPDKGDTGRSIVFRGNFSVSTAYFQNGNHFDVVKYGSSYYIYKGTNGSSGAWNSANWENFGGVFESISTGILLAELAYIENLGVKNLRTATSGQRVEITQNNNALAFYDGKQSTPVVEIKTTSDAIYMGQGSGVQVKHSKSNISIYNAILQNGSEGAGVSVPVLPWGQPDTIAQNCIIQTYSNSNTKKYKTGLYIDVSGSPSTSTNTDKFAAIFATGGIFLQGDAADHKSSNVLSGVSCAGRVNSSGTLYKSWVISFMGGYLSSRRISTGKYRISFSNTSYLYGSSDYHVFILPDAPISGSSGNGAYGCTTYRGSSYFDVRLADDESSNDCGFTFIVFLISKFF